RRMLDSITGEISGDLRNDRLNAGPGVVPGRFDDLAKVKALYDAACLAVAQAEHALRPPADPAESERADRLARVALGEQRLSEILAGHQIAKQSAEEISRGLVR